MPDVRLKFDNDELRDNRPPLLPKGWYMVQIMEDLSVGKVNWQFLLWETEVLEAKIDGKTSHEFDGVPFEFRTTIERGTDKVSKRYMFHQAMRALGVAKETDKDGKMSYLLTLDKEHTKVFNFKDRKFWLLIDQKENEYKGNTYTKNEVKHINVLPEYYKAPEEGIEKKSVKNEIEEDTIAF